MLWLLPVLLLTAALMWLPLTCTVQLRWLDQLTVTLAWQAGPVHLRQQRLWPRPAPRRLPKQPDVSRRALITELRRSGRWQRMRRHIRLQRLTVQAALSLSDAARSARICGLLNSLPQWLPADWQRRTQVCILPDFWSGRQTLAAECIFSLRLGMLLADAAMLTLAVLRQHVTPHKEG